MNKKKLVYQPQALYELFSYWSTIDERTVFQDVYQVPVGSYVIFDKTGKYKINHYHHFLDYENNSTFQTIEDIKEAVSEGLSNAISKRTMCDKGVKWGMYLSGGLDSTLILNLLEKMEVRDFPIYSLSFDRRGIDESAYQRLASINHESEHKIVEVTDDILIDNLFSTLVHCETPLYKLGAVPMYLLSKEARNDGVKFVLSGEGADEIFYGYDIYKETLIRKFLSKSTSSKIRLAEIAHVIPPQYRKNKYIMQGYEKYYSSSALNTEDALFSIRPRIQASSAIYDYPTAIPQIILPYLARYAGKKGNTIYTSVFLRIPKYRD